MVKYLIVLHTLYFQMHKGIGIIHLKQTQNEHAPQSSELRQFRFRLQNCSSAICVPCVLPSTNLLQKLGREIQLTVYVPELAMGFLHFGSAKFYITLLNNQ